MCLCRWTGDPVIARAQCSSPSPHSELGSAAAQTSTHVNKEHKDGRGGTSALQLLHACKLGNYKVAEHLARLAAVVTMKSYKSDASRNVMMERDSEGVSCLHAIAQSPCLGKTAWTSDNSSQSLSNTAFYAFCSFVCSCVFHAALLYIKILQRLFLSDHQPHSCCEQQ